MCMRPLSTPPQGEFSMSLDSDVIVDRRRIRRKLTFWRVTSAVIAIAAIVAVGLIATPSGRNALTSSGSIARINIEGLIRSDQDRVEALERLEKTKAAAVIVHLNSPGGRRPALRRADAVEGEEAAGRVGRGAGRLWRLHHGDRRRSHRRPAELAGWFDRRIVPVSEFHRSIENRWRAGRSSEVL